ncbi:histidine-type phosphatase [Microvirga brassicacearum]|uniref:Histidine-type phosphatase n=1 Tax=Microvirga brassicacearum TaxID=2580413 RepID=A0A5N3P842_9HYPH|nr:histidine-type phosphatase [Microvirga brassicacearum]KAB0265902.1 histidine-type phosphatase [Microvirga brassicacearum]
MRKLVASLLLAIALSAPAHVTAETVLEKVVIFSRHGVRPPTSQKALDPLSIDAWPSWPVPDGNLTPHGAAAATLMGQHFRTLYVGPQFIDPSACPTTDDVFAWADKSERTRATATAILAGLFPGCGLAAGFNPATADALFHPTDAGIAPLDAEVAKAAVLAAMGGDQRSAKKRYAADFAQLAAVLRGPTPLACMKARLGATCRLIDLPWSIRIATEEGNQLTLEGPLADASTVGEIIRLEYSGGMPPDQVGWGRIKTAADVKAVLSLHKAQYDVTLRVPYIAKRNASQILNQIALALEQGTDLAGASEQGPPPSKLLLMVGHDSNIATMQAALGVEWQLEGYPANDTPPGGAIVFERSRDTVTNKRSVRAYYTAQTTDQIRNLIPPFGDGRPRDAALTLPGCPHRAKICELTDFFKGLESRIDRSATGPVSYQAAR